MKKPKSIQVKVNDNPDQLISKVKQLAESNGVQFLGDNDQGILKGYGIEAGYFIREDILTVTIFRKPMLLSWAKVEKKVRKIVMMHNLNR